MLRYYITDRKAIGGAVALLRNIARLGNTVDILQIREKELPARDLSRLVGEVMNVTHPSVRVLVNDRADVALACGAHGVHLRGNAIAVPDLRLICPAGFTISVSCHSTEDVRTASKEGADYALLSPIFAGSKGTALGLSILAQAARASDIPVLALGGVEAALLEACEKAGAAGFAAIRCFQQAS